ncbi:MAG: hypothetical protein U1E10_05810 [Bdellovibrionales bacterium]|nr:hypothetical protein [Bdellovibrionales bacterium]
MTDVKRKLEPRISALKAELARASFVLFAGLLLALTLLAVSLIPQAAEAQETLGFLDYDGTIVENRKTYGGTHSTTHVLFHIQEAGSHYIAGIARGPETIEVSQQDYSRIISHTGEGHGKPGAINLTVTLEDGRLIRPGMYFPKFPETFKYFRESQDPSRNFLLEDFIRAEEKSPNGEFKGRFWDVLIDWCATAETAKRLTIFTARGHSEKEWTQLFDHMIKKGHIKFRPGRVVNLSRSEYDKYGPPNDMPQRKANFIGEQVQLLSRIDLPSGERHTIVVADDEKRNVDMISEKLEGLAFSGRYPVKMLVGNAGLRTEIRESRRPEFGAIEPGKSFRPVDRSLFFPSFSLVAENSASIPHQSVDPTVKNSAMVVLQCEAMFVKVRGSK